MSQLDGQLEAAIGSLLSADLHHAAGFLDHLAEQLAFVDGQRHRFFGVEVLAGLAGVDGHGGVPVVGRAVYDHVDVVAFEQLAVIGVDVGLAVESLLGALGVGAIQVADRHHVAERGGHPGIAQAASAHADGSDRGAVVFGFRLAGPGVLAGEIVRSDHRGGGRGAEELSTGGGWARHIRVLVRRVLSSGIGGESGRSMIGPTCCSIIGECGCQLWEETMEAIIVYSSGDRQFEVVEE